MFDVGFPELIVIAVVALVVLGPERLPKAARFAGLWVRRARNQWDSVKSELERELAAEELKRNLHQAQDALRRTEEAMRRGHDQVQREIDTVHGALGHPPHDTAAAGSDDTAVDAAAASAPETTPEPATRKDPGDERPHA